MKSFLANWKTSLSGVFTVAMGVLGLFGVSLGGQPMDKTTAIGLIVAGITGIVGKDGNVTGGTVSQ